jgi:hypothetical protein
MAGTINKRLPTASDAALRVAEAEAEKAEERRRAAAAAEAEKKALLDSFQNPRPSSQEWPDTSASFSLSQ